ncbi:universal stress protein [Mycolicibacterium phlei]
MSANTPAIVVGVDGSESAAAAANWAAAVAAGFDAPLELVTGSGAATPGRLEKQLRAGFPDLDVVALHSDLPAAELLTERSHSARMVVLGSEELSPIPALLVGSTTLSVAAHSACPVVAWRGRRDISDLPVVLGVDDPAVGAPAFDAAFEFAARLGVELRAVHAWPHFRFAGLVNPYLLESDAVETLQWQDLMSALEPWATRYPEVTVRYYLEPEAATKTLLRHAGEAQLVVVGGRRRAVVANTLLGSTSLNLLHHCPVPVMVCHRA